MDADNAIQGENSRESLFFYGDYDLTENTTLFAQGIYGLASVKGPWFSEEADSVTAGLVYQPAWLAGFSASADWHEIDLKGALFQPGFQFVVDDCYAGDPTY